MSTRHVPPASSQILRKPVLSLCGLRTRNDFSNKVTNAQRGASMLEYIMSLAILLFVGVALNETLRESGQRRYLATLETLRGDKGMAPCSPESELDMEKGECL